MAVETKAHRPKNRIAAIAQFLGFGKLIAFRQIPQVDAGMVISAE